MLRLSRCALFTLLFAWGCAQSPEPGNGSSSSQPVAGNKGGASSSGSAGKSGGSSGSTSSSASSCVPVISNLVTGNKWVCDMNTDLKIQGSFYSFGDGSSCTTTSDFCSASGGCCMAGATVVDSTYAKWGCGLGLELNASGGTSSVKSAYAGPVTCFDITLTGNSGGNVVRIGFTQAANTTGKVSPFVQLEPFTNGVQKKICLADAECPDWAVTAGTCSKTVGTAGTPYDLQIQVPGGDKAGSFNVCVTKIVPIMGGSVNTGTGTTTSTTTGDSCSSSTGQGTFTSQYESNHVTCNSKDYVIQNNAWGSSAGQTITYGPGTKFKVTKQSGTGSGGAPASFPSIFIGGNNGRSTTGSGLPKGVSALSTVPTSLTWASNGASGAYNTAYDVWFSSSSSGEPASTKSPTGGFLMVWFYKPNGKQPIGTIQATSTIAGNNWNVWYGMNTGVTPNVPCVSYVAQQSINSLTFDLNAFIKDAVDLGYVKTAWGLTNVFAGFEIWDGGTGLEIKDFSVTVN